jgi:hypothetical protein
MATTYLVTLTQPILNESCSGSKSLPQGEFPILEDALTIAIHLCDNLLKGEEVLVIDTAANKVVFDSDKLS